MCNEGQSSARWNSKKKQFSLSDCRRFSSRCFHLSEVEMWYLATGTRRMVNSSQCVIYRLFCYHPRTEDWKLITQRVCGCFIPLKQNVKLSKSFSCSTNFDCVSLAASYGHTIIFNDGDTKPGQKRSLITPESFKQQCRMPGGGRAAQRDILFKAFSPQQHFPHLVDQGLISDTILR